MLKSTLFLDVALLAIYLKTLIAENNYKKNYWNVFYSLCPTSYVCNFDQ